MCGILGYSHISTNPEPEVFTSALYSLGAGETPGHR